MDLIEGDDPVDKTGCRELSDMVMLCHDKHKDWRLCQNEMKAFRQCYTDYLATLTNPTSIQSHGSQSSKQAL